MLPTSKNGFSTELTSNLTITNANEALELLSNNKLNGTEVKIANKAIMDTARIVPINDKLIKPKFSKLQVRTDIHYPSHEKPLKFSEYLHRLSVALQIINSSRSSAEEVTEKCILKFNILLNITDRLKNEC